MIGIGQKVAVERRRWRTGIPVAPLLLAVVSLGVTLGLLANGAVAAAAIAAVTTASVATEPLPGLIVALTYQVTLVHGIIVPFPPSTSLLLLLLLLM